MQVRDQRIVHSRHRPAWSARQSHSHLGSISQDSSTAAWGPCSEPQLHSMLLLSTTAACSTAQQ